MQLRDELADARRATTEANNEVKVMRHMSVDMHMDMARWHLAEDVGRWGMFHGTVGRANSAKTSSLGGPYDTDSCRCL